MKKGYTLAEVVGVFAILAAIILIIIPTVDKELKDGKTKLLNDQIKSIENSLDLFATSINLDKNTSISITLTQLKQAGFLDVNIKNPVTNQLLPNDMVLNITDTDGIRTYEFDINAGDNKKKYEKIPHIELNGSVLEYVELGDTYVEKGTSIETTIDGTVSTDTVGVYKIYYSASNDKGKNKIIRNVVVRDTTGPTINFSDLTISLGSASSYDFKRDITVSDNSGVKEVIVEKNFGAVKGTYSVKYTAIDNYNNETVKYRKVTLN